MMDKREFLEMQSLVDFINSKDLAKEYAEFVKNKDISKEE